MEPSLSYGDIVRAHERLAGVAHRTPILTSATANKRCGAEIFFKCENFQRVGAFKFRGGYNALAQLGPEERARGVAAFSSGNHAQAVALSARLLGMRAVIIMPSDSPAAKIAATGEYGAEVVLYDRYADDREALARRFSEEQGLTLIHPFDDLRVMAGQGTAAKELFEDCGSLDVLLAPVSGGGLLSGCAAAAKALCPECRVYGVEPEAGDDGRQSLRKGTIVRIEIPKTIADGAQSRELGRLTFPVIKSLVADIFTVSDTQLRETMRFFAERMKIVVEPTGCLAPAALFAGCFDPRGKRIGVILSGGNVDSSAFGALIAQSSS